MTLYLLLMILLISRFQSLFHCWNLCVDHKGKSKPYLVTFHEIIFGNQWIFLPTFISHTLSLSYIYIYIYISIVCSKSRLPSQLWLLNTPTVPLQSGKPPHSMSVQDMTLNNLMVRFQWCWNFGKCGVPLHCHCSQVHSGSAW